MKSPSRSGFTVIEVLVAVLLLTLIVLAVTQIFDSAATVVSRGNKRFDADGHARALLDRMGVDFAKMVKRTDVDYFLKEPAIAQQGNDQIAFFCDLSGYYPSTGSQSPLSLVAYRINSITQMERMGKGLVWNGVSQINAPLVFLPVKIGELWPTAVSQDPDPDYELAGPQVFRFEYYYLLRNGTLSVTPWDTAAGHSSVEGLADVAAICVLIATLDPKSRVLVSDAEMRTISDQMLDAREGHEPGALAEQWQDIVNGMSTLPREASSSIRVYERCFYVGAQ